MKTSVNSTFPAVHILLRSDYSGIPKLLGTFTDFTLMLERFRPKLREYYQRLHQGDLYSEEDENEYVHSVIQDLRKYGEYYDDTTEDVFKTITIEPQFLDNTEIKL